MTIKQTGGIFGRNPTFNDVDIDGDLTVAGDLTVQGTTITVDSATAQSIVLGDNDKMTFGDGPDLEIYSDGTTGQIAGNVNVTGTVTADGLTVDGAWPILTLNDTRNINTWADGDVVGELKFATDDAGMTNPIASIRAVHNRAGTGHSSNDAGLEFYTSATTTGTIAKRMEIESVTGDIQFFEDTGTTAKLTWDASAEVLTVDYRVKVGTATDGVSIGSASGKGEVLGIDTGGNGWNPLDIRAGSATQLYLNTNGNVGIGTSSPTSKLHISDTSGDAYIRFDNPGAERNNYIGMEGSDNLVIAADEENLGTDSTIKFRVDAAERMRIDSSGRVGINNTAPDGDLTVGNTSVSGDVSIRIKGDATSRGFLMFGDAGGAQLGDIMYDHSTDHMRFRVNNAERLRIDSSGNVGIGTSSPSRTLSVNGVAGFGNGTIETIVSFSDRSIFGTQSNHDLDLRTNATERLRITSDGSVGIGTSSPSSFYSGARQLVVGNGTGENGITMYAGDTSTSYLLFADGTSGTALYAGQIRYNHSTNQLDICTNNSSTPKMTVDSSGNVGIGTNSVDLTSTGRTVVQVEGSSNALLNITDGTSHFYLHQKGGTSGTDIWNSANSYMRFATNDTEAMRIDASGNLLVGQTSANSNVTGIGALPYGSLYSCRDGGAPFLANRKTSDGDIALFQKDGATVGSIGVVSVDQFYFAAADGAGLKVDSDASSGCAPCNSSGADLDNSIDVGHASNRWNDIYATNALIQTSDRNEKQDIAELDEAERRVAVAAKGLIRKFRWKDAVAEKGDDARIHFGIIAQELQAAFEAEGLDAGKYAMFIHSTWTDEETGEERSRMGVRYSELLAFIIAAI